MSRIEGKKVKVLSLHFGDMYVFEKPKFRKKCDAKLNRSKHKKENGEDRNVVPEGSERP